MAVEEVSLYVQLQSQSPATNRQSWNARVKEATALFRGKNTQNQQQKCWLVNMMLQIKSAMLVLLSYLDVCLSFLTISKKIHLFYGTQWDW